MVWNKKRFLRSSSGWERRHSCTCTITSVERNTPKIEIVLLLKRVYGAVVTLSVEALFRTLIIKKTTKHMSSNVHRSLIRDFIDRVIHRSHLNTAEWRHGTGNSWKFELQAWIRQITDIHIYLYITKNEEGETIKWKQKRSSNSDTQLAICFI